MDIIEIVEIVNDFMLIQGLPGQIFIILLNFLMFAFLTKIHSERIENIFLLFLFYSIILFLEGIILFYLVSYNILGISMEFVFGVLSAGVLGIFLAFLLNKVA